MITKLHTGTICLLFVFFAVSLAGCDQPEDQSSKSDSPIVRPVKTIVVEKAGSVFQRSYPAVVLPAKQVELSFRVSGRIVELPIRAAMQVKKGDVVARLDTRNLESDVAGLESKLQEAGAQLSAMTSGARSEDIASLQAGVEAAAAKVKSARGQSERTGQLFERGFETRAKLESDVSNLEVAEAELRAREQDLKKGQAGSRREEVEAQEAVIKGLEAQLKAAKDNLSDATLRAPFDGIIARRDVDNFANIQSGKSVALQQQLDTLELTFDVPGPDVVRLARIETLTRVRLDAIPDRDFEANLVEFSTQPDPATQTYQARVSISPSGDVAILPGMAGRVIVTGTPTESSNVTVPATAIAAEPDGRAFVWIVTQPDNKVTKGPVETGEATGADVFVRVGLEPGDIVVTAGVSQLQPDMVVRPVSKIGD